MSTYLPGLMRHASGLRPNVTLRAQGRRDNDQRKFRKWYTLEVELGPARVGSQVS